MAPGRRDDEQTAEARTLEASGPRRLPDLDAPLPRGTTIRRFVIVEQLGAGAMGVVYHAYDFGLDRKVALKLLRDPKRPHAHTRLMREAKALAKLSHPNVVTVYDAGDFRDQVFIAMEFVDGRTLGEWLAESRRSWREVLEVFLAAGEGLAVAHAAGVVHRDFKPENVMIDRRGRVRVGDFGLALIGRDADPGGPSAAESEIRLTVTGGVLGTPAYMAPEQHAGGAIDARADQFGFCVALYEALYGEHPFGDTAVSLVTAAASGKVREAPRQRRVPARLRRALLRGLAADPADRFPSMTELLASLRGAPSRRRRALAAGALATAAAVLIAASRLSAVPPPPCGDVARPIDDVWNAQRKRALHAAFVATASPLAESAWQRVEAALDARAAAWADMRRDACEATRVRGEQSEVALDLRMQCLDQHLAEMDELTELFLEADASVVLRAADAAEALAPLDACARAAPLLEEVPPPDARTRREAKALRERHARTRALLLTGDLEEGVSRTRALVDDARALGYQPVLAASLVLLGQFQHRSGQLDAAEDTFYDAIEAGEAGRANEMVARAWLELVWLVGEDRAEYAEAHRLAQVARGALARLGRDQRLEAVLADRVGVLYLNEGKLAEAREPLERGLALREAVYGPDDSETAASLQHLALLASAEGRGDEAIALHGRARRIAEAELGAEHPTVLAFLSGEGSALYDAGRYDEAEAIFTRAYEIIEAIGATESPYAASFLTNIGLVQWQRGQLERALDSHERALALHQKHFGADHPHVANVHINLALVLGDLRRFDEAISHQERAAAIYAEGAAEDHAATLVGLGELHLAADDPQGAIAPLERAVEVSDRGNTSTRAQARQLLSQALFRAGRDRRRARRLADEAIALYREGGSPELADEVSAWLAAETRR